MSRRVTWGYCTACGCGWATSLRRPGQRCGDESWKVSAPGAPLTLSCPGRVISERDFARWQPHWWRALQTGREAFNILRAPLDAHGLLRELEALEGRR